jgi:hypothetical protein
MSGINGAKRLGIGPPEASSKPATPWFSFGMRMGSGRENAVLSMNKMTKSLGIMNSTWKNHEEM